MSKVYVAACPSYDASDVERAFHAGMEGLSGGQPLIQPGQRVALKANLLQAQLPEKAMTTHPAIVAAVARWVKDAGATPVIFDAPGGLLHERVLRRVYEVTGMAAVAHETGAVLNYDVSTVEVHYEQGKAIQQFAAVKMVVDADAIINLPKLKTHGLVQFTGAVKNLFGTVPGVLKGAYHARFPSVERFSTMLTDIASYYHPVLTVMDAIVGMEGDGPSAGDPRHIGLLLLGTDAVAVDVVATHIVGMAPLSVPTLAAAVHRGLTTGNVEDIEVLGSRLEEVRVTGFRRSRTGRERLRMFPSSVPAWLTEQLLAWPQAGSKCTACGVCAQNCPVQAITVVGDRAHTDLQRCIRCYCCHELCPVNAVELHHSLLGRLLNRL